LNNSLSHLSQKSLIRLIELTRKLATPYELQELLHEVLDSSKAMLEADSGSLWLYEATTDSLEMQVPAFDIPVRIPATEGLVGECLTLGEIINVPDCYADPRFNRDVDKATGYKTRSLLSIPLLGLENSKVGVMQLLNKAGGTFNAGDELMASALAAQCAVALQRTQMIDALIAKERLDEEVSIATQMQQATLPTTMPVSEGYEFTGKYQPAEYTGGDLFDLVTLEDRVFLLLGDATGHGFGPALSATQMQGMLRVALRVGATLPQAYRAVNNQLVEDLPDDRFLTAFMGFLNPVEHRVDYYSGGQGPILHYHHHSDSCDWLPPTSFPVGVMEITDMDEANCLALEVGDILAVISDGVYEYENDSGVQFGEDRVASTIRSNLDGSLDAIAEAILSAVKDFGKVEQDDDITLIMLRRLI
jgi:sigma-B regulation protein RsbU (phosphoserine phosphatase)